MPVKLKLTHPFIWGIVLVVVSLLVGFVVGQHTAQAPAPPLAAKTQTYEQIMKACQKQYAEDTKNGRAYVENPCNDDAIQQQYDAQLKDDK